MFLITSAAIRRKSPIEYLDGETNLRSAAKIKAHLDYCVSCRTQLDELSDGLTFFNRVSAHSEHEFSIDLGLQRLASAIHIFTWQQTSFVWHLWYPASAAFALAPAYQWEAVRTAQLRLRKQVEDLNLSAS